jgi:two-component system OmpR family response regulator
MPDNKVLVVEDDANLLETLKYNLRQEGYDVVTAGDGEQAIEVARKEKPGLLILDIMLPKINGFEVCRILRKEMTMPILMLTARADETDKIVGLEIGADDYMTKPFSIRELLARVRAMLRRTKMAEVPSSKVPASLKIGNLEIDASRHRASLAGEQLLEKVWGYDFAGDSRTVDVHIRWLRQKIEADPSHPKHLTTVRGTGYKLEG